MDAINVLMYFVVVTLLFLLLAKHSSAALLCKRFINKRRNYKMFLLFNGY